MVLMTLAFALFTVALALLMARLGLTVLGTRG
jgi:hypothetical protein